MNHHEILEALGPIDIYLLDQVMKGRLAPPMRLLDAGCGGGRNLIFFLRAGFDVHGVDRSQDAVDEVRALADRIAPSLSSDRFVVAPVEELPFPDHHFEAVLCNAVLHFARDESHFRRMILEMWRVLRPGGLFFARLASSIGIERRIIRIEGRTHRLPDGSIRFLVDEPMLLGLAEELNASMPDPLKTVMVQNQRCMTTWVLRKPR